MRLFKMVFLLAACSAVVLGQTSAQHGIQPGDIDRTADPCTDFFQYANGAWRAQNPIPASMSRWSRRWQAGELSTAQLQTILEEVSKRHDWQTGSVEQQIGDFYGACKDESRANKLGLTPIQPLLADIDKMKNTADVQRMVRRLHELFIFVPFALGSASDNHHPGQVIADISASGLGLPDRDYYFKTEPRFVETREKYHAYVTNIFKLAGYDEPRAKAAAETVFQMESKLAGGSLDNVSLRDPNATDHPTSFSDLKKLTPAIDWTAYFLEAKLPQNNLNVQEPKFLQEVDRQLREISLAGWKTYLKWQVLDSAAPALSAAFVEESFNFHNRYLNGAKEMKPRWKICVEAT